jgi:hypothetical protein
MTVDPLLAVSSISLIVMNNAIFRLEIHHNRRQSAILETLLTRNLTSIGQISSRPLTASQLLLAVIRTTRSESSTLKMQL